MKTLKYTLTLMVTIMASMIANCSGLYLISGYDFRTSNIRYMIETTNDNQTVEITPYAAKTLSVYSNPDYTGQWEIKTDNKEFEFGEKDNLRQGSGEIGASIGNQGCTNIAPFTYTYTNAGRYRVKLID